MQYRTVQYSTVQYNAVHNNTVQYITIQYRFREISESEIKGLVDSQADSTAYGHDRVDSIALKMAGNTILAPLRYVGLPQYLRTQVWPG